jgi:hypothetical protein
MTKRDDGEGATGVSGSGRSRQTAEQRTESSHQAGAVAHGAKRVAERKSGPSMQDRAASLPKRQPEVAAAVTQFADPLPASPPPQSAPATVDYFALLLWLLGNLFCVILEVTLVLRLWNMMIALALVGTVAAHYLIFWRRILKG